jgi:TPR repeat protein
MNRRFVVLLTVALLSAALFAQTPDIASLKAKAAAGDAASQLALARVYEKGQGLPQNDELAAKWYRAAAEQGNAEAQSGLGLFCRLGRGVPVDKDEAVQWYRKAAKQGYAPAMFNLATAYYNGDGVAVSDTHAYAWFVLAQRAGSKEAADAVARMEADLPEQKVTWAKSLLADMCLKGEEVSADPVFGIGILQQLADQNNADAQLELARIYADGKQVPQDYTKAAKYLSACPRLEAKYLLANLYFEGLGVSRDAKQGIDLLKKASRLMPVASLRLGDIYWSGSLVKQNYKEAVVNYQNIALLDSTSAQAPRAMYMMGLATRDGLGVKKNPDEACLYCILATALGSPDALKEAPQFCSHEKIEKAKESAKAWLKQHPSVQSAIDKRLAERNAATGPK